jgi:hypothetical protein
MKFKVLKGSLKRNTMEVTYIFSLVWAFIITQENPFIFPDSVLFLLEPGCGVASFLCGSGSR